ncbi:MAG: four-carbon acid sugar kinase family protein [Gammaproteobacteria bacterium]|nr:four-carbon acid sugar kinase family protein [Gammaproteobacteria bacterium]MDX2461779.1 four-carbon acid sugar kinase family protein [Gammaproteobacteria bacterium]
MLGCIADDFTGATDLANTLVRQGMRSVQLIGVPDGDLAVGDVDAIVIALKSRTNAAAQAVTESLAALRWLRAAGCRQYFFKYCSTFDSTAKGNIGPVTEALMQALDSDFSIACPAFPENGRTLYKGHLFVGDALLSESGMQNHPLTPMTDANLVRVLAAQCTTKVGLVPFDTVERGARAIVDAFEALRSSGHRHAIVDAISDTHLTAIGEACADLPLVTGGSGVAVGLPSNFRRAGLLANHDAADSLPAVGGLAAVLSGSCSSATLEQVNRGKSRWPSFHVDPMAAAQGRDVAAQAIEFANTKIADGPVLIYASAAADEVSQVQAKLGRERASALVEDVMARVARGLVDHGVRKLVVAGGETSGAVVNALGIGALRIGPQIDPGVPWTASIGDLKLALALKSGNFGGPEFFHKALECIE